MINFIIGFIVGIFLAALVLGPKVIQRIKLDEKTIHQNDNAKIELQQTIVRKAELDNQILSLTTLIKEKKEESDEIIQSYLDSNLARVKSEVEESKRLWMEDVNKSKEDCKAEYLQLLQESMMQYQAETNAAKDAIDILRTALNREQSIVDAAIEMNKRAAEMKDKEDFYRLVLSDEDKQEISQLKELLIRFRDPTPLNKVIWKTYYERPYTDLIGRVVGNQIVCGIYKITNLKDGKIYIGQAVNIKDRWKQHIKKGMGAEAPGTNKLYAAMLKEGVENFSFEIAEKCDSEVLTEREKFWTDYYRSQEFGYNIRRG